MKFHFDKRTELRTLDISINDAIQDNKKPLMTSRNIVPSEFKQARTAAGPMGYHEFVIDGSNYEEGAQIIFTANKESPLKVILENCKGSHLVYGLEHKAISKKNKY